MKDYQEAREKWLHEEIARRYEELVRSPSASIPAETVRARFEAKHRERTKAQ